MLDGINERIAVAVPFMTGAFRDAALAKNPLFSAETALAEYAFANAAKAKPPVFTAAPASPQSQVIAATPVADQILASLVAPAVADDPAFVPAFRKASGSDGVISWSLNSTYFATRETAQWVANKFGTGEVTEVPFAGNGGIFTSDANEFHMKLKDGSLVNAGLIAGYYERNPPDKFPGLAEKLVRSVLGLV